MIPPRIHSNGSNPEQMIEAANRTKNAIYEAIIELRAVEPNGRDYYNHPSGPNAFTQAQAQYNSMLVKLESVRQELQDLAIAIDEGGAKCS